ncbi:alpha/beta-hydrolase, partial [Rhizopogon vinicolor AM-OR11-026]
MQHYLFLPACLLRPSTTSHSQSPTLQVPKTVSFIDGECIGVEQTLLQGLTVNVVAPADATPESNLPVVIWIFGGGFESGSASPYDGSVIVNTSIALNVPAVYVSINYRLTAFGFLASEEVKQAGVGNLGLQD